MPTLLEVKFTRSDGKRETDTRVEAQDMSNPLALIVPSYCALAKLAEGAEVRELLVTYRGEGPWQEKYEEARVVSNHDLGTGFHAVELRGGPDQERDPHARG